jgi:hypothetical protein
MIASCYTKNESRQEDCLFSVALQQHATRWPCKDFILLKIVVGSNGYNRDPIHASWSPIKDSNK